MKLIISLLFLIQVIFTFSQQITLKEWEELSKTDIRLLPKYGLVEKTDEQKKSDEAFITETMKQEQFNGNRTTASNHLIALGFNYYNRGDLKTAMYRFNQAYLLDTANAEIYWGYGAIYMVLGAYDKARSAYEEGLKINPDNAHILTDYGTYFLAQYYGLQNFDEKSAFANLEKAIEQLLKSYEIDKTDQNTVFKLSICYWIKGECENAWNYYNECKALGGQPITEAYTKDLKKKCRKRS